MMLKLDYQFYVLVAGFSLLYSAILELNDSICNLDSGFVSKKWRESHSVHTFTSILGALKLFFHIIPLSVV